MTKMGKVFVTGGSGFVGKNLIPLLIQKGYSVNALARSKKAIEQVEKLGATAVTGDMNDVVAIAGGMENCDTIFHLAASTDTFATADELYDLNVLATSLLLKAAKKADIKNFVYLGAASVVINGKPLKNADENFVSDNLLDGYSRTKLEAENLVLAENSKKFKTISVRPPIDLGER
jgi:nucleoside-diphosphate-sugar epimerase